MFGGGERTGRGDGGRRPLARPAWLVPGAESSERRGGGLRAVGRAGVWLAVGLVFAHGIANMLNRPRARTSTRTPAVEAWPDDAARSLAVRFARAYLTNPGTRGQLERVAAMAIPQLRERLATGASGGRRAQRVKYVEVANTERVSAGRALITVAVTLDGGRGVRRVVVAVARPQTGGPAVFDLPGFAGTPARGSVPELPANPVGGQDANPLRRFLVRFLRAYLSGDRDGVSLLATPGASIAPAGHLRLLELIEVGQLRAVGARRLLVARVLVGDRATRAVYPAAFRVEVVRRGGWSVSRVEGGAA